MSTAENFDFLAAERELEARRAAAKAAREAAEAKLDRARKSAKGSVDRLRRDLAAYAKLDLNERRSDLFARVTGVEVPPDAFDADGVTEVDGMAFLVSPGGRGRYGFDHGNEYRSSVAVARGTVDGRYSWHPVAGRSDLFDLVAIEPAAIERGYIERCRQRDAEVAQATAAERAAAVARRQAEIDQATPIYAYEVDSAGRPIVTKAKDGDLHDQFTAAGRRAVRR